MNIQLPISNKGTDFILNKVVDLQSLLLEGNLDSKTFYKHTLKAICDSFCEIEGSILIQCFTALTSRSINNYVSCILDDNFDINPFFDLFKIDTSKDKWNVNGYFLESSLLFSQKYESQYLVLISKNQIIIENLEKQLLPFSNILKLVLNKTLHSNVSNELYKTIETLNIQKQFSSDVSTFQSNPYLKISDSLYCTFTFEGKIVWVNDKISKLLNINIEKIVGNSIVDIVHPNDKIDTIEQFELLKSGKPIFSYVNRVRTGHGYYLTLEWYAISDIENQLIYATSHNITPQIRLQNLLESTSSISKIGGWEYDVLSRQVSWTNETYKIYEIDKETPINIEMSFLYCTEASKANLYNATQNLYLNKENFNLELDLQMQDGRIKHVVTTSNFEVDEKGAVVRIYGTVQDITEKKNTENKLRQREEIIDSLQLCVSTKLGESFFETLTLQLSRTLKSDFTFIASIDKNIAQTIVLVANNTIIANIQYELNDTPCQLVLENNLCVYPNNVDKLFPNDILLKEMGVKGYVGVKLIGSNNNVVGIMVALYKKPIKDQQMALSIMEIMSGRAGAELERLSIEKKILLSEEKLKLSQQLANVGFWQWYSEDDRSEWSEQVYKIHGLDINQKPPTRKEYEETFMHPEDFNFLNNSIDNNESSSQYRIINLKGELRYVKTAFQPIINDGLNIGIQGSIQDITELVHAQEEVSKLALILEKTDNAIFITDKYGKVNWVNNGFLKLTNFNFDELNGHNVLDLFLNNDTDTVTVKQINDAIRIGKSIKRELILNKNKGKSYWAEISFDPVFDNNNSISSFIGLLSNIDKRKKAESDITSQNDMLKKVNHELDHFVYRVSHDLRAPISSVMGLIKLCKIETEKDQLEKNFDFQLKNLQKLDRFIKDILEFSLNARMEIQHSEIDFKTCISDIFNNLNFLGINRAITKEINIEQNSKFISDDRRMNMILSNLLSNAIRFADISKPEPFIHIDVKVTDEDVFIIITDNGVGIEEQYLDKIYDMFFRANFKNTGSGLGLYIVKEAINKLNGNITVNSIHQKGTSFMVRIPNLLYSN